MGHGYNRYESGMMLPPATAAQRWIEAQRIMADIVDEKGVSVHDTPGSKVLYAEGAWRDEEDEAHPFVLERYIGVGNEALYTIFLLSVTEADELQKTYYIDTADEIDVRGAGEGARGVERRRQEVYGILASIAVGSVVDDTHFKFEQLVTRMAARETPFAITAPMMNWAPSEFDDYLEELIQARARHQQSRINPTYLAPGSFNSQYQLQLESATSALENRRNH